MVSKREEIKIIREAKKKRIIKFKESVTLKNFNYVRRQIIESVITKEEINKSAIIQEVVTKGPEHLKIVEYLVGQGANINLPNPNHSNLTPINKVALFGSLFANQRDTLEKLINMGADINIPDRHLKTPLMNCIVTRSEYSIEFLIEKGSNLSATDFEGLTALHYASVYDLPRIVSKILQLDFDHSNAKAKDIFGMTPMLYAIEGDCEEVIKKILTFDDSKIDLNVKNIDGDNAIELALAKNYQRRDPRLVKMILYHNL